MVAVYFSIVYKILTDKVVVFTLLVYRAGKMVVNLLLIITKVSKIINCPCIHNFSSNNDILIAHNLFFKLYN